MKNRIIELAKANGADIVGFAPAGRFDKNSPLFKIMPETKTVIGFAFRVLRGVYRGVEEGSTYYQYTAMGVQNMEETIMPMAQLRVCNLLEEEGYLAMPQRRHQMIMAEENSTNPEVNYNGIYRGKVQEKQIDFLDTAVKCGLGEKGFHNALLTDEFGPMVRYCFVLTDAVIDADEVTEPHLCDKCGKCKNACPGKAISDDGKIDEWQCAVYYRGANGTKNPFMPPNAFSDFDDRIEIISGEAKVTPETARGIIDHLDFYPPVHIYQSSICARACDIACYVHLEEKGVLVKKFKTPFRKREEWKFSISDFE
ncbi:MAG: hypothetical protein II998_07695 [Clostridia bacterium]|nr:hypothetical protein [Clostridia bacterium]